MRSYAYYYASDSPVKDYASAKALIDKENEELQILVNPPKERITTTFTGYGTSKIKEFPEYIAVYGSDDGIDIQLLRMYPDNSIVIFPETYPQLEEFQRDALRVQKMRNLSKGRGYDKNLFLSLTKAVNIKTIKDKTYLILPNAEVSPIRLRRCPQCHGKKRIDLECEGALLCNNRRCARTDKYSFELEKYESSPYLKKPKWWHPLDKELLHSHGACSHGLHKQHLLYNAADCPKCEGIGKINIGNKPVPVILDGHPLRLRLGTIVKTPLSNKKERIPLHVKILIRYL